MSLLDALRTQAAPPSPPPLDPEFLPAVLWNRAFRRAAAGRGRPLALSLERPNGARSVFRTEIFPHEGEGAQANLRYVERLVKSLLWIRGGRTIEMQGDPRLLQELSEIYSPRGPRAFDDGLIGRKIYGGPLRFLGAGARHELTAREIQYPLGRHLDGGRIGFDLGGSDRKGVALVNGEVVFSEEIPWDPYFQEDPQYHRAGIQDTLKRCAAKLPRVDAIGGSAAGVYVDNQVRVSSLFRGIPEEEFGSRVAPLFLELQKEWGVPLTVVNDGDVTALAGSMSLNRNAVLGISMGTSVAGGYVTPAGTLTDWLNELAFVPIDYRDGGPVDEWSGDEGCCAQYFSQQGVARLAERDGRKFPPTMGLPERLAQVQAGPADAIFDSIGVCFGYAVAHFADFYEFGTVLALGRVMSGTGGERILRRARTLLAAEFPELKVDLCTPDERARRLGQAAAAATLPALRRKP